MVVAIGSLDASAHFPLFCQYRLLRSECWLAETIQSEIYEVTVWTVASPSTDHDVTLS